MLYENNNKELEKNQLEILSDKTKSGKEIPWRNKKMNSILLAESYERLGLKKFYRVRECGTYLEFRKLKNSKNKKLTGANFCKDRLCPMCSWRRSLKIFGQASKIMDKLQEKNEYQFLFVTLTSKNVKGEDLAETLDKLFYGINKFFKIIKIKKIVKGYFRALEVTHNLNKTSENFDTYHPHFHIILAINKSYFKDSKLYIKQKDWSLLWQQALDIDYIPIVDIRKVKDKKGNSDIKGAVAESAKYTIKDNDYIVFNNEELTDSSVMVLNSALHNRRLVAFGGEFKKIHKLLNLDDAEKNDLINTDNSNDLIRDDIEYIIERYRWNVGFNQYIKF